MSNVEENAFQIARYLLENPQEDGQVAIRNSLGFSDEDFRLSLKFLVDGGYCNTYGQFGGTDAGIRQKNLAKLQDFVNQINRNRIPLSLDAERLAKFLFDSSTPTSDSEQTMNALGWQEERYKIALETLKLKRYIDIQYADDKPFDIWITNHGREMIRNDFRLQTVPQSPLRTVDSAPMKLDDLIKSLTTINLFIGSSAIHGSAIGAGSKTSSSKKQRKEQQKPKVFISYSRDDLSIAEEIYQLLLSNEYNVWMDKHNLVPGQDWELEIRRNIKSSDFFIACLSPRSLSKRGYVQKELKLGLSVLDQIPENKIFFIPIRIEDCEMPESLSSRQWLDWSNIDAKDKLLMALKSN